MEKHKRKIRKIAKLYYVMAEHGKISWKGLLSEYPKIKGKIISQSIDGIEQYATVLIIGIESDLKDFSEDPVFIEWKE